MAVKLPHDEGAHKVDYEWWYAHGHLQNEARHRFAFMFYFFKFKTKIVKKFFPQLRVYPGKTIFRLHLGLTDITRQTHHFDEYTFISWPGRTGAKSRKLDVYYGPNRLHMIGTRRYECQALHHHKNLNLHFYDQKGAILHGRRGLLTFPKFGSTYYYSYPRLKVEGAFDGADHHPKEYISGSAWLDHQWGNFAPAQPFIFWNWAGIQLEDGSELMIYEPFDKNGKTSKTGVTWFGPKGQKKYLVATWQPLKIWQSSKSKVRYPIDHMITIPALNMRLRVNCDLEDQEMASSFFPYWEGACSVVGYKDKQPISGKAFVELTGYDRLTKQGQSRRLALP